MHAPSVNATLSIFRSFGSPATSCVDCGQTVFDETFRHLEVQAP
jgi:hypothetical protein